MRADREVRDVVWTTFTKPAVRGRRVVRPTPLKPLTVEATPGLMPPEDAETLFARLQELIAGARRLTVSSEPFPWPALERLLGHVIAALQQSDELFTVATYPILPPGADYLAFHQARVGVLSLRLGVTLGYDGARLLDLGAASCLCDVGLWQIPDGVCPPGENGSAEDHDLYRSHPWLSATLVRCWSPPREAIVDVVLQHHERMKGQGYPRGLRGAAIHPDAQIIGLIDTYAGLTAPPPPRRGLEPHDAIRKIVGSRHELFPPALVKTLLAETSVFPPGTLVKMSTGEVGRVVAANRNHPLRPRVRVLGTPTRPPRMLDLSTAPFIYITAAVTA